MLHMSLLRIFMLRQRHRFLMAVRRLLNEDQLRVVPVGLEGLLLIRIAQELDRLLSIHIDPTVHRVGLVSAVIDLVHLSRWLLGGCAPLVLFIWLFNNILWCDHLYCTFLLLLNMVFKAATTHLFAAIHALLHHFERWLVLEFPIGWSYLSGVYCFCALALVLNIDLWCHVFLRGVETIVDVFDFITAQVSIEDLIFIAHTIIPIKINVTPIPDPQEIALMVVFIVTDKVTFQAATEPLPHTGTILPIKPVTCSMMLPVSDALLYEVAEFLKEVQLYSFLSFGISVTHLLKVISGLGVLLSAHDWPTARKLCVCTWWHILYIQAKLVAGWWLLWYAFRPPFNLFICIMYPHLFAFVPGGVQDLPRWIDFIEKIAWWYLNVSDIAFDMLLFITKYLIWCQLPTDFKHFIFLAHKAIDLIRIQRNIKRSFLDLLTTHIIEIFIVTGVLLGYLHIWLDLYWCLTTFDIWAIVLFLIFSLCFAAFWF